MSDHYEVVFSCFLRDDTPESVMAALRWHLGMDAEFPENLDDDEGQLYPLLDPDNHNSCLPGGDVVSLRRTVQEFTQSGERYEWELFARKDWLDDSMLYLRDLLDLLAPHAARPGYGGHFRNFYGTAVTVFTFRDGTYEPIEILG
ncbi:hypothetical protein [Streptomyces sp. NBC_00306]|uniref:hypothetical protein n=1 Tax=Streptomyces sp. NBC_00306 TaxID=2975708 RepID=UPI002E2A2971|nr:hypothetical protein [Streptomyces sp. NBC_00306]